MNDLLINGVNFIDFINSILKIILKNQLRFILCIYNINLFSLVF